LHFIYDESVERGVRLSRLIDDAIASQPEDVDGEKS
jgi:ribosome-binding factor A